MVSCRTSVLSYYADKLGECLQCLKFDELFLRRNRITPAETGTNSWIWSHRSYLEWEKSASGILWIEGKPGSGKSVLAMSIWKRFLQEFGLDESDHKLDRAASPGTSALISSWFYSKRDNLVAHVWMLRSILLSILEQDPSLFPHAQHIYRKRRQPSLRDGLEWGASPLNKTQWDPGDIGGVLPSISEKSTTPILCVLDGFDESANASNNQGDILSLLKKLVKNSSKIKVIVLSRPTVDIEKRLRKCYHIVMQDENPTDITKIVDIRVQSLIKALRKDDSSDEDTEEEEEEEEEEDEIDDQKLQHVSHGNGREDADSETRMKTRIRSALMKKPTRPSKRRKEDFGPNIDQEDRELTKIRQYLFENAQGVILWVTTVLDTLQERFRRPLYDLREIRHELERLPKDIQDLYHDIAKGLHDSLDTSELEMARRALMWTSVVTSTRPFHVDELLEALAIDSKVDLEANPSIYPRGIFAVRSWTQARRKIQRLCGPFIEIIPPPGWTHNEMLTKSTIIEAHCQVQLLHQTVKDFLEDERCAAQLYIPFQAAQKLVEEESRIYVRIALPAKARDYSPLPATNLTQLSSIAQEVVEYLEQRRLLPFILRNYPNLKAELLGNYLFIFGRNIETLNLTRSATPQTEVLAIPRKSPDGIAEGISPGEAAILVGHYFEVACTQGYNTAVRTLGHLQALYLFEFGTEFGIEFGTEFAHHLHQIADRIKSQIGETTGPARTRGAEMHTIFKVDTANSTDRMKAKNIVHAIKFVLLLLQYEVYSMMIM